MTKERFEELALIMAKVEFNTDWECDDWETQSEKWKNDFANGRRAALTAVYPLIRDEAIEECEGVLKEKGRSGGYGNDYTQGRFDENEQSMARIRALKSKDTKL